MIDPDRALKLIREAPIIAYDVETSGLTEKDFVCGYVVTDSGASLYVPVRHEGGGNIPLAAEWEQEAAHSFRERTRRGYLTVGHNLAFDLRFSSKHGIVIDGPLEDTMINEGLIDDIAASYSLESCCERNRVTGKLGADLYRHLAAKFGGLPDRKQMANYWRLSGDDPIGVDYACGDGISTLELALAQHSMIEELGLSRVHKLECELIPHLARIRSRGVKIDSKYGEQVFKLLDLQIAEARKVLSPGFAVRSPNEIESAYRKAGIDNFDRTPTGKPSFTESWLQTNEMGQAIIKVRQLEKARDSFIVPLVETHNVKGYVHPSLNQSKSDDYGAIGGRLSCSDPNLQAYPKRNRDVGRIVRPLVIPEDGMLIAEDDFVQQEPRLFAHYSEDANLLGGYLSNPPIDVHTMAANLTGWPRDQAKRIGLGIFTGLGYNGLALKMGWPLDEATAAHKKFLDEAFPGVREFQKLAKYVMLHEGSVRTLLGRIAHKQADNLAYKAVSRIIQGSGADHMKLSLLRACQFAEANPSIQILLTIHDSFLHQFEPDAPIEELRRVIESTAQELELLLPIPVERGIGKNGAEASYGGKQ